MKCLCRVLVFPKLGPRCVSPGGPSPQIFYGSGRNGLNSSQEHWSPTVRTGSLLRPHRWGRVVTEGIGEPRGEGYDALDFFFFSTHPLASVAMPTSVSFIPTPTGRGSGERSSVRGAAQEGWGGAVAAPPCVHTHSPPLQQQGPFPEGPQPFRPAPALRTRPGKAGLRRRSSSRTARLSRVVAMARVPSCRTSALVSPWQPLDGPLTARHGTHNATLLVSVDQPDTRPESCLP